jgi:hypothetical protein
MIIRTVGLGRQDFTDIALKLRLNTGQDFDRFILKIDLQSHFLRWLNVSRTQNRVCITAPSSLRT